MLNKVMLQGRIGNEIELKTTANGTEVVSLSLAVKRNDKSGTTDWFTVVLWKEKATFVNKYFSKGNMIVVAGSLQTRTYTTQNGEKRYTTEIVASEVHFAGDKSEPTNNATAAPNATPAPNTYEEVPNFTDVSDEDSLPF